MDLVIITVSYNTRDLLADCLESVQAGLDRSGLKAETWVVDNASADGSAEMVRRRFPAVRLVATPRTWGSPGATTWRWRRWVLAPGPPPGMCCF